MTPRLHLDHIAFLGSQGSVQLLCSVLLTGSDFNRNLPGLTPRKTFERLEAKGASWSAKNMPELLDVLTGGDSAKLVSKQVRLELAASVTEVLRSPLAFHHDGSAVHLFELLPTDIVTKFRTFLATFPEYVRPSNTTLTTPSSH